MVTAKTEIQVPHGGRDSIEAVHEQQRMPLSGWSMRESGMQDYITEALICIFGVSKGDKKFLTPELKLCVLRDVIQALILVPTISALGLDELKNLAKPLMSQDVEWTITPTAACVYEGNHFSTRVVNLLANSHRKSNYHIKYRGEIEVTEDWHKSDVRQHELYLDEAGRIIDVEILMVNRNGFDQFPHAARLYVADNELLLNHMNQHPRLVEYILYGLYANLQWIAKRARERAREAENSIRALESIIGSMRGLEITGAPLGANAALAMAS